jgi:hypothetical protein
MKNKSEREIEDKVITTVKPSLIFQLHKNIFLVDYMSQAKHEKSIKPLHDVSFIPNLCLLKTSELDSICYLFNLS